MPSTQAPINSGFNRKTTAEEALGGRDLTGLNVIVTGGYSGLGLETTRVLAGAGANVLVPVRTPGKGAAALAAMPRVEQAQLDLLDPASIDRFAADYPATGRPLHILVNSAGVMATPLMRDARGYEAQFATNHLGHFHLAARLWPALVAAKGARVVAVSSRGHRIGGVDFEDPNFHRREYSKWKSYGQSKSANVLFSVALDTRGEAHGVRAFSLHPGSIPTDLSRHLSDAEMIASGFRDENGQVPADKIDLYKTVEQGAATSVWCAANRRLEGLGGVYCDDVEIAEAVTADTKEEAGVRPWAIDPALAERLWGLSEDLTGVKFVV